MLVFHSMVPVNAVSSDDSEERVWREPDGWTAFILAGIFYATRRSHLSARSFSFSTFQARKSVSLCFSPSSSISICGRTCSLERTDLGQLRPAKKSHEINLILKLTKFLCTYTQLSLNYVRYASFNSRATVICKNESSVFMYFLSPPGTWVKR